MSFSGGSQRYIERLNIFPKKIGMLPDQLMVQLMVWELAYIVETPGFRTKKITIVTTLLDTDVFTKEQLADLYLIRWRIEVNFRGLKTTMGMDIVK